jgi:hypothetical protein
MHHSPVMKAAAIVSVVFGLALLLAPNALVALYNAQPMSGPGLYNSSLYGGLLIGFGIINWMARSDLRRARGTSSKLVLPACSRSNMQ